MIEDVSAVRERSPLPQHSSCSGVMGRFLRMFSAIVFSWGQVCSIRMSLTNQGRCTVP